MSQIKLLLYNTLSKTKETFLPINKNLIKMYVCGPTVYDDIHIGNARSIIVYDILYRILGEIFGFNKVLYIRNITDIDDKIIQRSQKAKISISELTNNTISSFYQDTIYLGCKTPNQEPRATDHINDMIQIIQKLLDLNHAYVTDSHVFFNIANCENYGFLSGRYAVLENIESGSELNKLKKNLGDFVLWKPIKEQEEKFVSFESPWGLGRPGWHIECTAMSYKYLGENFDIHGGGIDLIFPHHTNEIAQNLCAFPKSQFAKFWIHNGFLTVNGSKMSKSNCNFITIKDLVNKGVHKEVARMCLMYSHYRKPLNFSYKSLENTYKMLNYWYTSIRGLDIKETIISEKFFSSLLNDMNVPLAIRILNDYAKNILLSNEIREKVYHASYLVGSARFMGLMMHSFDEWVICNSVQDKVSKLIEQRNIARKNRDWILADKIRDELAEKDILLEDCPDHVTRWRYKSLLS